MKMAAIPAAAAVAAIIIIIKGDSLKQFSLQLDERKRLTML